MKMTLLEIVQNIMLACEMDEVNSIGDTPEAEMVAQEVRTTYYELFADKFMPSHKTLIQLDGLSDVTKPNYLKLPENCKEIDWFKYNWRDANDTDYREVSYLEPETFLNRVLGQNDESVDVEEIEDFSGVILPIRNDRHPELWTSFDNLHIVTNSWDEDVDSTLHSLQSLCWGTEYQTFTLTDSFTPALDDHLFPLLLSEAKGVVFLNHKGTSNPKEEQRSKRQLRRAQNDMFRLAQKVALPDYGRRGHRPRVRLH